MSSGLYGILRGVFSAARPWLSPPQGGDASEDDEGEEGLVAAGA